MSKTKGKELVEEESCNLNLQHCSINFYIFLRLGSWLLSTKTINYTTTFSWDLLVHSKACMTLKYSSSNTNGTTPFMSLPLQLQCSNYYSKKLLTALVSCLLSMSEELLKLNTHNFCSLSSRRMNGIRKPSSPKFSSQKCSAQNVWDWISIKIQRIFRTKIVPFLNWKIVYRVKFFFMDDLFQGISNRFTMKINQFKSFKLLKIGLEEIEKL